eukprot:m.141507 g.141507  ORF g.141507 m.141507 type:complete len:53 (+) comp14050_c0_seq5:164-322(+)
MDAGQNPAGYDAAVSLRDGGASAKESAGESTGQVARIPIITPSPLGAYRRTL